MMKPVEIKHLSIAIHTSHGVVQAVRDVSLTLNPGESLALVGESGCGKSILCKSILKLLPREAQIMQGSIQIFGEDIIAYGEKHMRTLRGSKIAMAFQNPMTTLNPSMTMGAQLREAICLHQPHLSREEADQKAMELLTRMGIQGKRRLDQLPQSFSGGQRQRCMLAIALAQKPEILIADEPTTALDATVQKEILLLLKKLRRDMGLSMIFITHDLGVAAHIGDRVGVMYAGRIVEIGTAAEIFHNPRHPYTWGLLSSMPVLAAKGKKLPCIQGQPPDLLTPPPGDAFAIRNPYALAIDYKQAPPFFEVTPSHQAATWLLDQRAPRLEPPHDFSQPGWYQKEEQILPKERFAITKQQPLLQLEHLSKTFDFKGAEPLQAVHDVTLSLQPGECLGLVGESGSGKSTLARLILGIHESDDGKIFFDGQDITHSRSVALRQQLQMIFQDADAALNPRMTTHESIGEGLKLLGIDSCAREKRISQLLDAVELTKRCADAYPAELSGGQRQRVAIARCLAMNPRLIVADEPVAALDVSVQAQIINLLCELQEKLHFSMIFIAHDLSVVRYISDRVAVMYKGSLLEQGATEHIFRHPQREYTKKLLSAVLYPELPLNE